MKVLFRRIHLYLGICTGLIVMISCLTGTVLVFQDELEQAFNRKQFYITPGNSYLPLSQLLDTVKNSQPKAKFTSIRIYKDADRTVEFTYQLKDKKKTGKSGSDKPKAEDNIKAYVNPYTGQIIKTVEVKNTFYHKVLFLHRQLLAGETGKLITGISTLLFVLIIVSGVVIWWPKKRKQFRQKLTIKKDAGWKRTLYDWHSAAGVYSTIFLFTCAFTGLAFSFKWFNNSIYYLSSSPVKSPEAPPSATPYQKDKKQISLQAALYESRQLYPEATYYNIIPAKNDTGAITVQILPTNAKHKSATDVLYFDQYSGSKIGELLWQDRSRGAKIRSYFLPLHTGTLFGLPHKIILSLACLAGSTLSVTGVIIWLNRIKKKNKAR